MHARFGRHSALRDLVAFGVEGVVPTMAPAACAGWSISCWTTLMPKVAET